jgi:hypothetical protein
MNTVSSCGSPAQGHAASSRQELHRQVLREAPDPVPGDDQAWLSRDLGHSQAFRQEQDQACQEQDQACQEQDQACQDAARQLQDRDHPS